MRYQDDNSNTISARELFPQQDDVDTTNALMIKDQHQFMSHQGGHSDICSSDVLLAQWSAFIQYQPYDQHQLMTHQSVNINRSNANELFLQKKDIETTYALIQDKSYDQHQLMSP